MSEAESSRYRNGEVMPRGVDLKSEIYADLADRRPQLMEAVNQARNKGARLLLTHWAFLDDPETLAAALAYAYDEGVTVVFAPDSKGA